MVGKSKLVRLDRLPFLHVIIPSFADELATSIDQALASQNPLLYFIVQMGHNATILLFSV
jgi:hypothetical protein